LRDGNHKAAKKEFGHVGYKYAHDFADGWVDQEYVPTDAVYYEPTDRGHEAKIKARVEELRRRRASGGRKPTVPDANDEASEPGERPA
jgi:putative ATPase